MNEGYGGGTKTTAAEGRQRRRSKAAEQRQRRRSEGNGVGMKATAGGTKARRRNKDNGGGRKAEAARLRDEEGQKQTTPCHGHGTTALRLGRETNRYLFLQCAAGGHRWPTTCPLPPLPRRSSQSSSPNMMLWKTLKD